jgi:hypothetical protein
LKVVAALLSAWVAWRWLGFFAGVWRVRRFSGPDRREARRTVVARGAFNVFWSVGVIYLWAGAVGSQPGEALVGFFAAAMMCSLAIGIVAGFMQPQERNVETLDVVRVIPRRASPPT